MKCPNCEQAEMIPVVVETEQDREFLGRYDWCPVCEVLQDPVDASLPGTPGPVDA